MIGFGCCRIIRLGGGGLGCGGIGCGRLFTRCGGVVEGIEVTRRTFFAQLKLEPADMILDGAELGDVIGVEGTRRDRGEGVSEAGGLAEELAFRGGRAVWRLGGPRGWMFGGEEVGMFGGGGGVDGGVGGGEDFGDRSAELGAGEAAAGGVGMAGCEVGEAKLFFGMRFEA